MKHPAGLHRPLFVGILRKKLAPHKIEGSPILLDGPIEAIGLPGCLRLNPALLELPDIHFAAHVAVERISGPPPEDVVRVGASLEVRFQGPPQQTDGHAQAALGCFGRRIRP